MLKDLLLVVDTGDGDTDVVLTAAEMAKRYGAHLTVLIVSPVPVPDFAMTMYPPFVSLDEYQAITDAKEATVRSAAERAGASIEIRVLSEAIALVLDKVPAQTRYSDLVLFGATSTWDDPWLRRRVLENTLLGSGRPILLLPLGGAIPSFTNAVVGWNCSGEAARSLHAVLPHLIPGAKIVIAVDANKEVESHADDAGADLAAHLSRHGFEVSVAHRTPRSHDIAAMLQSLTDDSSCDLLILGAYARSRMREFVFGGVTHDVVNEVKVPTAIMH